MHYKFFEIENYRGIREVRLDLSSAATGSVFTLVGLNESGKTTVLEAVSRFSPGSEPTDPDHLDSRFDPHDLIPISERDNFNGNVIVRACIELSDDDRAELQEHLESCGYVSDMLPADVTIDEVYRFTGSRFVKNSSEWDLAVTGRSRRAKEIKRIDESSPYWEEATSFITDRIPRIRYFPDFLFDLPDRIFIGKTPPPVTEEAISEPPDDEPHDPLAGMSRTQSFYVNVLQDVLDSLKRQVNVREHLFERATSDRRGDKRALDQLLNNLQREISSTVFGSWDEMFGREPSAGTEKRLVFDIDVDSLDDGGESFYLRWQIEDSNGLSEIGERSLGFRWFFVYRLLTAYRGRRKFSPPLLFLFDEPASNLHPRAQSLLLNSFRNLSADGNVIMTTHSHHLIEPDWLSHCYIVKNEGIDYDEEDTDFLASSTEIGLHKYRRFVNENPSKTSYFQPVLDTLDYRPSSLELTHDAIMLEGKWDYYSLRYMSLSPDWVHSAVQLVPGGGASALDAVIQLYLGWGRDFVVLLDSDTEGRNQADRYLAKFGAVLRDRVVKLGDISQTWEGRRMEDLFNQSDHLDVQQSVSDEKQQKFDKKRFNRGLEESVATGRFIGAGVQTGKNFDKLMLHLRACLGD